MNPTLIISGAVFLISLWRPRYGLAAIIILWPAYLIRTSIFQIPTTALELSLYAVVAAVFVLWLRRRISWHWVPMTRWTWWLLFGWVVAWVIATIFSPDKTAALGAFKAWLVDPLLFSALLAFVVRNENDRRFIIQAAITSGVLVALFGLYQMIWLRDTLQDSRLSSFFHPVANYAAMYLAPLCVLSGGLMLYRYVRGAWAWVSFGVMMVALVLTMSYGGFLAIAVGTIYLWHHLKHTKLKQWLAIGAVTVGLTGVLALSMTNNFSEHFNTTDRSSGLVRKQIWVTSWTLIQQHPVFGIGPNNFEAAYRAEIPKHYFPPLEWLVAQPHNLYLALWLELGALGLVAFLAPVVRHAYTLRRLQITNVAERTVAIVSFAALLAILAHGFVDTPYFKNDLAMEYMFLALLPWLGGMKPLG